MCLRATNDSPIPIERRLRRDMAYFPIEMPQQVSDFLFRLRRLWVPLPFTSSEVGKERDSPSSPPSRGCIFATDTLRILSAKDNQRLETAIIPYRPLSRQHVIGWSRLWLMLSEYVPGMEPQIGTRIFVPELGPGHSYLVVDPRSTQSLIREASIA